MPSPFREDKKARFALSTKLTAAFPMRIRLLVSAMNTPKRDYSETLFLPQTDFPMRAGLPQREPEILKRWEEGDLYNQLRAAAQGRENSSCTTATLCER